MKLILTSKPKAVMIKMKFLFITFSLNIALSNALPLPKRANETIDFFISDDNYTITFYQQAFENKNSSFTLYQLTFENEKNLTSFINKQVNRICMYSLLINYLLFLNLIIILIPKEKKLASFPQQVQKDTRIYEICGGDLPRTGTKCHSTQKETRGICCIVGKKLCSFIERNFYTPHVYYALMLFVLFMIINLITFFF